MKETAALKAIERVVDEKGVGMAVLIDKLNKIRKILTDLYNQDKETNEDI